MCICFVYVIYYILYNMYDLWWQVIWSGSSVILLNLVEGAVLSLLSYSYNITITLSILIMDIHTRVVALFSGKKLLVHKQQWKGITSSRPLAVYLGPVRKEHAPLYCPFTPQIWAAQLLLNVYSSGNWLHPVKVQVTSSCAVAPALPPL